MPARILIADDYDDNRELLRLILATAEYEVVEAKDGQECIELALDHQPDVIMIDLSMPKLDGWQACRALKADARTTSIPCIAVTAHAAVDQSDALQAGFKAYLTKPFNSGELLDVIGDLLGGRGTKV